jgi:hypothetical protein
VGFPAGVLIKSIMDGKVLCVCICIYICVCERYVKVLDLLNANILLALISPQGQW